MSVDSMEVPSTISHILKVPAESSSASLHSLLQHFLDRRSAWDKVEDLRMGSKQGTMTLAKILYIVLQQDIGLKSSKGQPTCFFKMRAMEKKL